MGGRTLTLTPAQKAEVEPLAAVLTADQVADYFGIGRTTFFALIQRDPEIAERYKRGRARAVGAIAQTLIAKARGGDTACMIFFLTTQAGWRETQTVEHALPEPAVAASSAVERLRAFLDAMAQRQAAAAAVVGGGRLRRSRRRLPG